MSSPLGRSETDARDDGTEPHAFPEVSSGMARVAALHLVEPVTVSLLIGDKLVGFAADDAMLDRAVELRHGEIEFSALHLPGLRPKLLRLDALPEGRPKPTPKHVAAHVASRWAETLRRLGEGPA